MPAQKARAPRNSPAAACAKNPCPAELHRRMRKRPVPRGTSRRRTPAQKARTPRNSPAPPHAGAKGPCPAELPRPAACRRKRPVPRGTPRRMPAQKARAPRNAPPPHAGRATSGKEANDSGPCAALTTKITIYRVKKGRRRIFSPRRPKPGQHRSPKPHPKARTETPSEGSRRGHAPKSRRRCGIRPPPHPLNRPGRVVKKGPSCRPTPSAKNGAVFIGQRHQHPDY